MYLATWFYVCNNVMTVLVLKRSDYRIHTCSLCYCYFVWVSNLVSDIVGRKRLTVF